MAIGPTLQEARLKKQLTTSKVAELTRMKIQIVEDLEKDDFHRLAAVIYGKGFIRLFAECVGLDPKPLVADYVRCVEGDSPSLIPDGGVSSFIQKAPDGPDPALEPEPEIDTEAPPPPEAGDDATDLFTYASKGKRVVTNRHESPSSSVTHTVSAKASEGGAAIKRGAARFAAACRSGLERIVNRLADIPWGDAPLKVIGVIIGILVVLLFVVSGISRCVGPHAESTRIDSELNIAVDPPEPYFD